MLQSAVPAGGRGFPSFFGEASCLGCGFGILGFGVLRVFSGLFGFMFLEGAGAGERDVGV